MAKAKKERYIVDGHCVLDKRRRAKDGAYYCVADCYDGEWDDIGNTSSEKYSERLAARIARLLNKGE